MNALGDHASGKVFALVFSNGEWKVAGTDSFMRE
jgi:hypothetical protein